MKVETRLVQEANVGGQIPDTYNRQPWGLKAELRGWKRLFDRKYRDRTMVGIFIMVFQRTFVLSYLTCRKFMWRAITEWSGINALLYYGPTIIRNVGLEGDTVTLIVSGGIGVVQFLAVVPAIVYIDQLGKAMVFVVNLLMFIVLCREEAFATRCVTFAVENRLTSFHPGGSMLMTFSHLSIALLVCPAFCSISVLSLTVSSFTGIRI